MLAPKTVRQSNAVMSRAMEPSDANPSGFVHGGTIMKLVDIAGAVAATRHCRMRTTTARMDSMSFLAPIKIGDLVTLKASVNNVGHTSMEVGVRVESEDLHSGRVEHVGSAYLVFVALGEDGRPTEVPPLIAETEVERRRMAEAKVRRIYREREAEVIQSYRRLAHGTEIRGFFSQNGRPAVVGHRGAMGYAPENTMLSFAKGLEMGADMIEFDVHLSKDDVPVVMHDAYVDRTTNGQGLIREKTLADLKRLDAGAWFDKQFAGQRVPTLDEVLEWAKGKTKVAIEIKNGPVFYPQIEEAVVASLERFDMIDAAVVISFDHRAVKKIKTLEPRLIAGVLYAARAEDEVGLAAAANADVILPPWSYVTPEVVANAHNANLAVSTWVVNDASEMECVLGLEVDGIGTNYPDRLRAMIDRRRP